MKSFRAELKPLAAQSKASHRLPGRGSIHWLSPALAALSLIFAIALALAHHLFYLYWDGKTVANNTQQQWIIRVGTAFAFLVNALFVVAVSYSLTQQVWFSLGRRSAHVSEVDNLFSILNNCFGFANLKLWITRPLLGLTAIIAWTIPIASIVPPGTLTVTFSQSSINQTLAAAEFNFSQVANFMPEYSDNAGGIPVLSSPGAELSRLSLASLSSMTMFQQTPPSTNCSFTMSLFAPALSCEASPQMMRSVTNATNTLGGNAGVQSSTLLFFSWAPDGRNLTTLLSLSKSEDYGALDTTSNGSSQIFLYSNGPDIVQSLAVESQPALVNCSLYNATYTLRFNFSNGVQTLNVLKRDLLNGIAASATQSTEFYGLTNGSTTVENEYAAYISLMTAFGNILTGNIMGMQSHLTGHYYVTLKTLATSTALGQIQGTWSNETLATTTEQMFQNMTLSLLSSNSFTMDKNATSPLNSVTVSTTQNVYLYKPSSLLISYGIVTVIAILLAILGAFTLLRNGHSFDQSFSTILRTTRHPDFSRIVSLHDAAGAEPCTDTIQASEIVYRSTAPPGEWAGFVPVRPTGIPVASAEDIEMTRPREVSATSQVLRFRSLNANGTSYSRLHDQNEAIDSRQSDPSQT